MMGDATSRTGRTLAWVGVVLGLAGLILQFSLSIPEVMSQGRTFLASIELYFSYFTILSNSALVLVYYAVARGPGVGAMAALRGPTVRAGMAAVMLFVCGFFHIVLAPTLNPQGWWMVADVTLHYAAPLFYALCWLVFA
ncbi:MAG: Pr6Pr family membrane protein, partial [Sphingomonadaceae bacterium]